MITNAKPGRKINHAASGRRRKLLAGAGGAALALSLLLPSAAWANDYVVNSEAELQAALTTIAGNADTAPRIVLGSSFSVSTATFTLPNKAVTIDTQGFVLTGPTTGQGTLIAGPSGTNTLVLTGNFGGNTGVTAGTLSLTGTGTVTSTATIRGSSMSSAGQDPGIALSLNGTGTFVNNGTIAAGDSISYALTPTGGNAGVAVSINSGGTLINNSLIQGSNGQSGSDGFAIYSRNLTATASIVNNGTIRGGSNSDPAFTGGAAIRGIGSQLLTVTNTGTLEGGNGAAAIQSFNQAWSIKIINTGTIRAGAGSTDAIRMDTNGGTRLYLELWATSNIEGNVTASVSGTEVLGFGGPDDASFDISQVSPTGKYRNFDTSDKFEKNGTSTWTLTGTNAMLMDWTINQGTLRVGDGGAASVAFRQVANNGVLVFDSSIANTVTSFITGTGSILQSGSGTTTLVANTNSYSGGTTITGGKLSVGSNGALGDVAGALTINGGTLQWTGASGGLARTVNWGANGGGFEITTAGSNLTIGGPLLGGGALVKSGAGVLTLAGDNTYTGVTTIASGTLNIGNGGTTGSVLGDIVNNSTLGFNRTDAYAYAGAITGTGGVSKANTGTLTLTGQNNYGAGTTISGGQFLIAGGGTTTSGGATSINVNTAAPIMLGVDGAGSAFSTTAITGVANLNRALAVSVTNGGHLTTTTGDISLRASTVSAASTNTAELIVDGAGSRADVAGGLVLAGSGITNGKLTISAGGTLHTAGASTIGFATGNTRGTPSATITGAGSNWTSTNSLVLSNGDFTVQQGGAASFSSATFGTVSAALPARLTVSGANSHFATTGGDLTIGSGTGTGELVLSDGASVDVAGYLVLANGATATGVLSIGGAEGQAATASGAFTAPSLMLGSPTSRINFNHTDSNYLFGSAIFGAGAINQVEGTTNLTGNSGAFSGTVNVTNSTGNGSTLRVNGTLGNATSLVNVSNGGRLGGAGTIGGNVIVTDGILAPGNSPGTLTIAGNLSLGNNSLLDYEFGQSNTVGGPLNDLIEVGGNLTLAGTIDVTVTPGGDFGPGVYRVISYGGSLTNNGFAVGNVPAGSIPQIQTSVAGQVNLANVAPTDFSFWDGNGARGDNAITGGSGIWQAAGGNDNWALFDGSLNNDYAADTFAIFMATGGTVTVDTSLGAVNASGMQFATDGYTITGGAIGLTGSQSIIRVGDGTAAGAGYTATIASNITGAGDLLKTDLGTLVLTGASTIAGDIYVRTGGLQLSGGGTLSNVNGLVGPYAGERATVTITGAGSTWTNSDTLSVGYDGTGTLNVTNGGTVLSNTGALGISAGAVGNALVSGIGSSWQSTGRISLGQGGTGNLRVEAGGTISSHDSIVGDSSQGNAVITGVGSSWADTGQLTVGSYAAGTLRIEDGASVTSNQGYVGAGAGSNGSVTVTGAGSNWLVSTSSITIGNNGSGSLAIEAGARVRSEDGILIGMAAGSSGTLTLQGTAANRAVLETSGIRAGDGTVNVTLDGALLRATGDSSAFFDGFDARDVTIGANGVAIDTDSHNIFVSPRFVGAGGLVKDGAGALVLSGDSIYTGGTTINAGILQLGAGGTTGSVTGAIANNGELWFSRSDNVTAANPISGSGSITKFGANTLTLTGTNSYAGATNVNGGTLLVNGDQSAATGLITVAAGATLGGTGILGGSVDMSAGGTLAAGSNGVGTLTINGNLALGSGSHLAFDLGQAGAVGGALNDLVNVGGNLTLDGTIDVTTSPGGSFDVGIYRVLNYAGALTNNGLTIGTQPAGADTFVQTSVAGQVNLVNVAGLTLNFWDGAAGPKNDGVINGGNGVWQARTGNDNWTDLTGALNAGYSDGTIAIFTGAAGAVTVDNGLGAVTVAGIQFASNGYAITGDAVTLTGAQAVIRVGDGTTGGAGYTATIGSVLTGASQLAKTDLGRLVLSGANSYTGGTAINGGVLQIASDTNLGAAAGGLSFNGGTLATTADIGSARGVTLAGQGVFAPDAGTTLTLTGAITGTGSLGKTGAGTLVLGGTGSFTGGALVSQGTLLVNGNYAAATGLTTVATGGTLGGTGTIGGSVALNGTLAPGAGGAGTLTIAGNLSIAQGATLNYELGAANSAGGGLNDLVNVGGNLVLDGTINVSQTIGGNFGAGIYRVFNYGGTLTDNGLTVGAAPAGSNIGVQTSVAGQVNLINYANLTLNFWDGTTAPRHNGAVNGGTGTWQNGTGNDNWTDSSGILNAAYADGAFAVFGGTAGTVTVDNGLGQVAASGMQFAVGGYTVTGGAIALTGAQATIRVGDGSTAGAGYTATINAALTGASQLVKTDAGTLILGGTNSYTGGTLVTGGTVQIASDANLGAASGGVMLDGGTLATSATLSSARNLVLQGAGTLSTATGTTFTLGGLLSGAGNLTKAGTGTLVLSGANAGYAGTTRVAAGTLAVTGTLGGTVNVDAAGRLEGTGSVGTVTNSGTIAPGLAGVGTLALTGNYTGANGTLEIEAELGGDGARADRLVVGGSTAGTTRVKVTNLGGTGAPTVEGIKIVDVAGASNGAFTLDGDYVFEGAPALIAGAYGYRLYKNGVATPSDGDWYLRSALLSPVAPPATPLYQPGVPVYEAYGQTLATLNAIGTMQERVGNRRWNADSDGISGIWGRMESARSRPNAVQSTSLSDVNVDSWKVELGVDQAVSTRSDGSTLVVGVLGSYGEAHANIASPFGNGSIKTRGYGAGATLSWFGPQGFYVDSRAQFTWFDSKLKSTVLGKLADGNHGTGQAYSVEVGKRSPLSGTLSVTPQIQMAYSTIGFDRFTDPNGAEVSSRLGDSLKTRWGISLDRQDAGSHLYGVVNLSYEWLDGTVTQVSGTPIARSNERLWGELGLGGSVQLGRITLYSQVSADTALRDFGKSYSLKGTGGLRLAF
ncbi:autotransporter outer membrane beta-barrel domain-containing protein [Sphingomonas kyeonggiensis]|uniref:Fibronectin-binding autotransporter adhesin n=1 Tax=Sphingomonas kyeonggiensis TaxID=1268553 RepID=A0A7W6NW34_9SPHN|nr:autotransporter outer membrane beta-barrel domain-containing protein [Sphingomonas kyeonggiensis]MBB4098719.1 fibronectin-binding autotransporter adhesin [Sphingomonas kyeonggiensis]